MSHPSCNEVQETIARGLLSTVQDQAHVAACPACAAVAQEWALVEAALDDAQAGVLVPDGFADRVMERIADGSAPALSSRWWERRWVQLVLANLGAAMTLANVLRFVVRVLIPNTSLGALP